MVETVSLTRSFESYNARFLTLEEVARTFIPPPQYRQLTEVGHSVLLGPRGSGKTTLLKMLQLRALLAWKHEDAEVVRRKLGYHSIFLGTDVLWGSQLESRTKAIADEEQRAQIRRTSFRIHLSLAFLNAVAECRDTSLVDHPDLGRFACQFDRKAESDLVRGLGRIWLMGEPGDSLLWLRVGLQEQLAQLLVATNKLRRDPSIALPEFVDLEPISSIISAIELTNSVLRTPEKRWAILCDELEIAPEMVRQDLFQHLRSTSHQVIFKFSLFPYSTELANLSDPAGPSSDNDYVPLQLYYGRREEAYNFCEAMLQGMLREFGARAVERAEEVLGPGWFDGGRGHRRARGSPFAAPHGQFFMRAQRLEKVDSSFRYWLRQNSVDIRAVDVLPEDKQAQYRKALPYILTRSEFLRDERRLRSRKSLALYTGTYSLFSATEGNPRIFINLMRPLIRQFAQGGGTVANEPQGHSLELTIHRFRSSLSAIPTVGEADIRSILQLIDVVGSFFQQAQLEGEFNPEPASTFVVDDEVGDSIVDLVGRALNAGAFVYMPDGDRSGVQKLRGARLRLAYTLAPEYKLALVSGRAITLSNILHLRRRGRRGSAQGSSQIRLPFGVDE